MLVCELTRIPCRLNKLLGDVVISQGGVVPHINPEVSRLRATLVRWHSEFCLAFAWQTVQRQEGESGGLDSLSLYHYCITMPILFYWAFDCISPRFR